MTPARNQWQLWGLRSSVFDRLVVALAASAALWLIGAWAMDWL